MEEYEYNFKVKSIEPFINFCKQNGYKEKQISTQNRVVYENKNKKTMLARITTDIKNNKKTTVLDFKNVDNKNRNFKISNESLPIKVTSKNKKAIMSILQTLEFEEVANNFRTRYVYEKNNVKFEIDDYTKPQMKIVAIEGDKNEVEKVKLLIEKLL